MRVKLAFFYINLMEVKKLKILKFCPFLEKVCEFLLLWHKFLERLLLVRQYDEINDGKRIIDENFYPTHSLYSVSFWDTDKGFSQHGGR